MAVSVRPRQAVAPPQTGITATQQQAAAVVPFTRASRKRTMIGFDTGNVALTAAAPTTPAPIQIPPGGYLRFLDLQIVGTTAANAATVTFAADGPFNAIQQLSVTNSAGDTIIAPITGYQLYLLNKYGALGEEPPFADPRQPNNGFVTTAGSGATGGSFAMQLRIPFELDPRDAFCALPNMASNKSYQLQIQFAASNTVYGVPPTTPPSVRITATMGYWNMPAAANAAGIAQATEPLGNGSVSMWRIQTAPVTAGDRLVQLTNVGNVIRTLIFVLRTAAGARTSADLPGISQIVLNNDVLFYWPDTLWQNDIATAYGYTTGAAEAAAGLDTGVRVLHDFMDQRGKVLVDGPRDQYLPTVDATLLQMRATLFGASANTLEVLSNEVKPTTGMALYSPNVV
jgi:hypothetical protein